ncbi:Syntaxin-binding protein, partial [Schistosoma japonicum]
MSNVSRVERYSKFLVTTLSLTCGHLPVGSSWLYLGTDKGNVNFVNVQRFTTSGYVINWNKAIDLSQSSHPGKVIQIAESPQDLNKILIGYSSGFLVLWDLKTKQGDARFKHTDSLFSMVWHWDGKSFLTSHNHGLIATWLIRQPQRPVSIICPHGKMRLKILIPYYEPFIIFSGGGRSSGAQTIDNTTQSSIANANLSSASSNNSNPSEIDPNLSPGVVSSSHMLTIKRGKKLVVLQLDHKLVQFTALSSSPYASETMDPYAVAILLQEDLVVIDLLSPNYATFENPYPMDLHSSPVTSCLYLVDCPGDLIPAFYSVSSRRHRTQSGANTEAEIFSNREWPITGGEWHLNNQPFSELIITGHADGSVRFWDSSEVSLSPLYKFRTSKLFGYPSTTTSSRIEAGSTSLSDTKDPNAHYSNILLETENDPFAIRLMHFCPDSRKLLTASNTHTCLLHFSRRETNFETSLIRINISYSIAIVNDFVRSRIFVPCDCGTNDYNFSHFLKYLFHSSALFSLILNGNCFWNLLFFRIRKYSRFLLMDFVTKRLMPNRTPTLPPSSPRPPPSAHRPRPFHPPLTTCNSNHVNPTRQLRGTLLHCLPLSQPLSCSTLLILLKHNFSPFLMLRCFRLYYEMLIRVPSRPFNYCTGRGTTDDNDGISMFLLYCLCVLNTRFMFVVIIFLHVDIQNTQLCKNLSLKQFMFTKKDYFVHSMAAAMAAAAAASQGGPPGSSVFICFHILFLYVLGFSIPSCIPFPYFHSYHIIDAQLFPLSLLLPLFLTPFLFIFLITFCLAVFGQLGSMCNLSHNYIRIKVEYL